MGDEAPNGIPENVTAEGERPPYVRRSRRNRPEVTQDAELLARLREESRDPDAAETPATRLARARGRAGVRLPKGWMIEFLNALAVLPVVQAACQTAGVSRATAYRYKSRLAAFSRLWDLAEQDGYDRLEREAWRRGVAGVKRPVYGKLPGEKTGTGKVGDVTEYSDRLLELQLKANRPERYRERFDVRHEDASEVDAEIVALIERLRRLGAGQPVPQE